MREDGQPVHRGLLGHTYFCGKDAEMTSQIWQSCSDVTIV